MSTSIENSELPNAESSPLAISVVIPVFNERESLEQLCSELREVLSGTGRSHEIVFVDDGSTDGSRALIEKLAAGSGSGIRAVLAKRHRGKAEAIAEGFHAARGEIILMMDADLQDVPEEIPRFLDKLDEGWDVVSGWKQNRKDPFSKRLLSSIFNTVVSRVTGIKLHDHNCGFKALRSAAAKNLGLYGELHRFIAVLASTQGYEVTEIPVRHRRRVHGQSKYGWGRIVNGLLDLLTVIITTRYEARPLHAFGKLGLVFLLLGCAAGFYLATIWTLNALGFIHSGGVGTRPLLLASVLSILFGGQLISVGLLAEITIRVCARDRNSSHRREHL